MRRVAESFTWPFRGQWRAPWIVGIVLVLFLPLTFIPVLGYAIEAIRAAARDPAQGPPAWRWSTRLFWEGAWTALAIVIITMPFAIAYALILGSMRFQDSGTGPLIAKALILIGLALPWGCLLLVHMPHSSARLAETGHWSDIFDFAGALRSVARNFAAWNATAAATVTGWAIGFACAGMLCVGVVPGAFYAILVSAHAAAAFHRSGQTASAG
jgi:hypothetical protein